SAHLSSFLLPPPSCFFLMLRPPPTSTLFPYTTLFRSNQDRTATTINFANFAQGVLSAGGDVSVSAGGDIRELSVSLPTTWYLTRSEEHTSELQSLTNLVCRLLLEKKKNTSSQTTQPDD